MSGWPQATSGFMEKSNQGRAIPQLHQAAQVASYITTAFMPVEGYGRCLQLF